MKVTYEFDTMSEDYDPDEHNLIVIASDMYLSLCGIQDYMRELYKGYKEDDVDKIMETVNSFIEDSEIYKLS